MNNFCTISPRNAVNNLPAMTASLPDLTAEEIRQIVNVPEIIKLSFNESPYGASPKVADAICNMASRTGIYHDFDNKELRQELAAFYGVSADMVVLGNGADEIITILAQALLTGGDEAIIPVPTFGQYAAATTLAGACPVRVPVRDDLSIDLSAVAEAISAKTKLIFLCNPNNPTGMMLDAGDVRQLLAQVPANIVVVLDEAYAEYVVDNDYPSGFSLLGEFPNIVTVRTFSKIYGLAGLRLGYAIAHPKVTGFLEKVRNPFNVNALAQIAGLIALRDQEFVKKIAVLNRQERDRLTAALTKIGFTVCPSQTNFLLVDTRRDCAGLCENLARKGIIIRPGTNWNIPSHVRISLGDKRQNAILLDALYEIC
jgi:histidinol-phosphate aminotransferase